MEDKEFQRRTATIKPF